jgi:hypothetical protein
LQFRGIRGSVATERNRKTRLSEAPLGVDAYASRQLQPLFRIDNDF